MYVAIAGGTSATLGASIVTALLATEGRYIPLILSRGNKQTPTWLSSLKQNVEVREVDYNSRTSLTEALHGVEVVISVLLVPGPDWVTAQVNLLHAAEDAGCRRFAPSEFALTEQAHDIVDLLRAKNTVWEEVQASIRRGKIDAARCPCGMFMNYLGIGIPDDASRLEALAGFQEGAFLFHLDDEEPWVEVPVREDGSFPDLTLTDIRDIGAFIVTALDLDKPWAGRTLGMSGDTINMTRVIEICEQHSGKPVEVREVTRAQLEARLASIPPAEFLQYMECQLEIAGTSDQWVVNGVLNSLSSIQPTTVDQFMKRYWGP